MIRKANIKDVKDIHGLLQLYAKQGLMLARPLSRIYDHLRDFFIYEDETSGRIGGFCALQICWEDMAEVRSLAVHPDFTGRHVGHNLVSACLEEARQMGINKVFTLTYQDKFFAKQGFKIIRHAELPLKIWSDCIVCPKYPDCDEIAMIIVLSEKEELT